MNGRAFLLDGGRKRLIPSLYALVTWRFHEQAIQRRPVAELAAIPDGAPVTSTPLIAYSQESGAYLVDLPAPAPPDSAAPMAPPPANAQPKGGTVNGMCAMSHPAGGRAPGAPLLIALIAVVALVARRRTPGRRHG